jgi:hypothetical protein
MAAVKEKHGTGAHKMLGSPQQPEMIRVIVFYGPEVGGCRCSAFVE